MEQTIKDDKKTALVLGGTSPHVELIKKLKARGYYIVLVDYLNDSPGIEFADEHIQESTLDQEKVLNIAKDRNVSLVISTCIDQANSVCCYVAEQLELPHPYSYQTSLDVTDKGRMKKIMREAGIPTSPYIIVSSVEAIDWNKINYPVVIKPVDCNSSKGVHRADNKAEVERYIIEALELSRSGEAIIEGFNAGYEIQVDCFASADSAVVLMTRQKKKITGSNEMVLQSTGSVVPAMLSEDYNNQAHEIAVKIAKAFCLKNTPFFYQAIVTEQGISVLEFAPRIGGGLSYYMLREFAGVDPIELAIDSFLGINNSVQPREIIEKYSTNLLYMNEGVFDHIEWPDTLEEIKGLKEVFQMKKKGTEIGKDLRSGNRVGAFVVEAATYEKLQNLEEKIYKLVKVINNIGEDALNRNVIIRRSKI